MSISTSTVNAALPAARRIRVVLGDTPIDYGRVHGVADADYVRTMENETDAHFAQVVETEVMAKGHRALLIAGVVTSGVDCTRTSAPDRTLRANPPTPEHVSLNSTLDRFT